jgi:hypothetical protein
MNLNHKVYFYAYFLSNFKYISDIQVLPDNCDLRILRNDIARFLSIKLNKTINPFDIFITIKGLVINKTTLFETEIYTKEEYENNNSRK